MLVDMEKKKNTSAPRKVAPLRFFVYSCLIVLGVYGSVQFFYSPDVFEEYVLAPANNTSVPKPKSTIVVFGDSVTSGYGIALDRAYPSVLERLLLSRGYDVRVINMGVSGETTAGGLRRVDFVKSQKPNIVVLALGGNDVLRGLRPEGTKDNLREIITSLQADGINVLLVGMYATNNLGGTYEAAFNTLYPELSRELNVPLVPFLLSGVVLNKELNQADGIHPNEKGAEIIAEENILPFIVQILKQ